MRSLGRRSAVVAAVLSAAVLAAGTASAAPRAVAAEVSGDTVRVELASASAPAGRWTVTVDGTRRPVVSATRRGQTLLLRLARPVAADDVVEVAPLAGKQTLSIRPADNRSAPGCSFLPDAVSTPGEGLAPAGSALRARTIRVALVFVAPDGLAPSESPRALAARLAPPAQRWFAAASGGRARLVVRTLPRWLSVGSPSPEAALTAAGSALPQAGVVVAVLPEETAAYVSYAETLQNGPVRYGVLLAPHPEAGLDRKPGLWRVLVHELGHVLGLPDLYVTAGSGAASVFAGPWDPMSSPLGQNLLAWHAWQLGWLDPSSLRCSFSGTREETLTPAGAPGGVKALVLPLGPTNAVVLEARSRTGLDAGLCDQGVLAYDVDTDVVPAAPELRVLGSTADGACGPLSDATLHPGATFDDAGVHVEVLGATGSGYRVRVTR